MTKQSPYQDKDGWMVADEVDIVPAIQEVYHDRLLSNDRLGRLGLKQKSERAKIWVNGKIARLVPQCANCSLILEDGDPYQHHWEYVQLEPHNDIWGWLCPSCQCE